uniref:Uncharacterized protein n=1 Tax=Populus trichocarpa TaxID=3694 RepID=A0A2K1YDW9_POPTR
MTPYALFHLLFPLANPNISPAALPTAFNASLHLHFPPSPNPPFKPITTVAQPPLPTAQHPHTNHRRQAAADPNNCIAIFVQTPITDRNHHAGKKTTAPIAILQTSTLLTSTALSLAKQSPRVVHLITKPPHTTTQQTPRASQTHQISHRKQHHLQQPKTAAVITKEGKTAEPKGPDLPRQLLVNNATITDR